MKPDKFIQTSSDVRLRSINYSLFLADGETLNAATYTVADTTTPALSVADSTIVDGTRLQFFVEGGVTGVTYTVDVEVTTSLGQTKNDFFHVKVWDDPTTITGRTIPTPSILAQVAASANEAETAASEASISAAAAAASQTAAAESATSAASNAAAGESASASATAASNSATAAATSAASAAATFTAFSNVYLGAFASAPTKNTSGDALATGDMYFDTTLDGLQVYDSSGTWQSSTGGATSLGNPSATIGLAAKDGTSSAAMRADGAPALDVSISPTWSGNHTFSNAITVGGGAFDGVANPTATIGVAGKNGTATTAMRSDGAPALDQSISPTWTGNHTFDEAIEVGGGAFDGLANPSSSIGLTAANGSATTAMRSDATPAISQAIAPTWTGAHTFTVQTTIKTSGGAQLFLDTLDTDDYVTIRLSDNGTAKWQLYKNNTDHSFHLLDFVGSRDVLVANSGGDLSLMPSGGSVAIGAPIQFSGTPWADITHPTWGAVGDGSTDNATAIQDAINYMQTTYGGGLVFVPPGFFYISETLSITGSVILVGCGPNVSIISTQQNANRTLQDKTVLVFEDSAHQAGARDIMFLGYADSSGTAYAVSFGSSTGSTEGDFNNVDIFGGFMAMQMLQATDWRFRGVYASGMNGGVISNGANFWSDCKFDLGALTGQGGTAFTQGAPLSGSAVQENQFEQCDFSGGSGETYTTSVSINDGATGTALTKFSDCIFSAAINITHAKWSGFSLCEFGSSITVNSNPTSFAASMAFSATTISGIGKLLDSACYNLS